MRKLNVAALVTAVACIMHASPALAAAVVTPTGQYARIVGERTILLWDEASHTEHLFVQLRVFGDAKSVAMVVPAPIDARGKLVADDVAPADDIAFGRLEALLKYDTTDVPDALPVEALPLRTLQPKTSTVVDGGDPLRGWLGGEEFALGPSFEAWGSRYVFYRAAAVRFEDDGAEGRAEVVETPMLRLSFAATDPFVPYTINEPEPQDEAAFAARTKAKRPAHALDLWVLSAKPVDVVQRVGAETRAGPAFHGEATLSPDEVAGCLGAIPNFDPKSRPSWILTRFADRGHDTRVAFGDLTLVPAKARAKAKREDSAASSPHERRSSRRAKALAGLLAGLAAVVAWALFAQRESRATGAG
jgi:hypothetical protein